MAAGGGIFTAQNKILPGAYINFVSKARALGSVGERGIVAMPFISSWGKEDEVISLSAEDFQKKCLNILGYSYTDNKMLPLREVFKGANEVKLFRLGKGTKASATIGDMTVTAVCGGARGNDIKIVIEAEDFTAILYAGSDETTKGLFASFIKRLRDDEGYKVTCVLHDYSKADFEGVISVKNSCAEIDNIVPSTGLVYWTAGKTAGAEINQSLTNTKYDGELEILAAYKKSELREFIQNGEFVFYGDKDI